MAETPLAHHEKDISQGNSELRKKQEEYKAVLDNI